VATHLPTILRGMKACQGDIIQWQPDALILIDYPGFNLSIAKYVSKQNKGIPIFYYISPKIWAWKERRIRLIRNYVDKVYSILPFEVDYYKRRHQFTRVQYVGNPSYDEVVAYEQENPKDFSRFIEENRLSNRPIIALLAGSRRQEIRDNLCRMLEAAAPYTDQYQLVVAGAPGIDQNYYSQWVGDYPVTVLYGQTFRILQHSTAALVTSGTATLETALFRVPQVVCYYLPMGWFYSFMRRLFLKIPYISLVNLIARKEVVPELVADGMTVKHVREALRQILPDGQQREIMLRGYDEVLTQLGQPGASAHAAKEVLHSLGFNLT